MRLVCPSCAAQYEVPDEAVPEEGRDVQCGTCNTSWFQDRPQAEPLTLETPVDEALPDTAPAEPEPEVAADSAPDETVAEVEAAPELDEPEPEPVTEAEAAAEEPEAVKEPEVMEEPEPKPAEEPAAVVLESAAQETPEPSEDLDFDFDFEFEDDDPAPASREAAPAPVAGEKPDNGGFDKSLHSTSSSARPERPSWANEVPQSAKSSPEPEDLSLPEDPELDDDDADLLAAVRGELNKMESQPDKREERGLQSLSKRPSGVAAAAASSGIVFDDDEQDDGFASVAEDLGDTLLQSDLEDLSAPATKGSGGRISLGFATSAVVFALAFAVYLLGPKIAATYPPSAGYLASYTQAVDQTRRIIEELASGALGFAEDKIGESDGS